MVETLSEKGTKDFAAETAKHFDAYVERILAQRLKKIASSDAETPPGGETEKREIAEKEGNGGKDRSHRRILFLLFAGSFVFLTGTFFLLAFVLVFVRLKI